MVTAGSSIAIVALLLFVAAVAPCVLAVRHHNRMFPKGFDRTGRNPAGERAGWLATKFNWLSGGGGSGGF